MGSSRDAVRVSQSLRRTRSSVVLVESFLLPQRQLPSFVWSDILQPCTCAFADTAEKYVLRVTRETSMVADTITLRLCWTGLDFWATTVKNHYCWRQTFPLPRKCCSSQSFSQQNSRHLFPERHGMRRLHPTEFVCRCRVVKRHKYVPGGL